MPTIILPANGWTPRKHQRRAWKALSSGAHTAVLAWHRRAGKDEVALHNACSKGMQRVGNYWHMLPMQEQARKALWEAVNPRTGRVRWKDAFPDELIEHVDNQGMKLTLKNNSTWQLLGSDNYNSLVGTTPIGMTLSEAALSNPNAYAFFRPILLENNGWSVHISSTRGRNHFYKLFQTCKDKEGCFVEHLSAENTDVFTAMQLAAERQVYIDLYGQQLGDSLFKQEYYSDWSAAVIGAVFGPELKRLNDEGRALPLRYDPAYPVLTSWDLGVGDTNVILFWQLVGNTWRLIDWYASTDTGIEHYAEVLADKPYFYSEHIGPHDITSREWGMNGVGRMQTAKRYGIKFRPMPNVSLKDQIAAACRLLHIMEINVGSTPAEDPMDDCAFVLSAFENYHFTFDKEHRVMSKNPVHDWSSHYCSALMTFALYAASAQIGSGRPGALQGRGVDEQQRYANIRLGDFIHRQDNKVRGAWG